VPSDSQHIAGSAIKRFAVKACLMEAIYAQHSYMVVLLIHVGSKQQIECRIEVAKFLQYFGVCLPSNITNTFWSEDLE
jgi:hypothetical protein